MIIKANSVTLDALELRALLTTASDDPCRVNLHAVRIEPAACTAVTTDGHRMTVAIATGERFPDAPAVVLPLPLLESVAKAAKKGDTIAIAWDDKHNVTATTGATTVTGKLAVTAFPPWRAVFPSALHRLRVPLTMNPYYLTDALGVLAKLQGKHATVTCWGPGKGEARRDCDADCDAMLSPIILSANDADRGVCWRIVIMPMRADVEGPDSAAWKLPEFEAPKPAADTLTRDDVAVEGGAVVVPMKKGGRKKTAA